MDERLACFLSAVLGLLVMMPMGAAFGAIAGAAVRASGRSAGGFVGLEAVRALERIRGAPFTPIVAGALVGAFDGAVFLGIAGALVAGGLTFLGMGEVRVLLRLASTVGGLAVTACGLGTIAYGLVRAGWRSVGVVFATAVVGGLIGIFLTVQDGYFLGAALGAGLGAVLASMSGWLRKSK